MVTTELPIDPGNRGQLRAWDGDEGEYWAANADTFEQSIAGFDPAFDDAALSSTDRVIDVGCGTGSTTRGRAAGGFRMGAGRGPVLGDRQPAARPRRRGWPTPVPAGRRADPPVPARLLRRRHQPYRGHVLHRSGRRADQHRSRPDPGRPGGAPGLATACAQRVVHRVDRRARRRPAVAAPTRGLAPPVHAGRSRRRTRDGGCLRLWRHRPCRPGRGDAALGPTPRARTSSSSGSSAGCCRTWTRQASVEPRRRCVAPSTPRPARTGSASRRPSGSSPLVARAGEAVCVVIFAVTSAAGCMHRPGSDSAGDSCSWVIAPGWPYGTISSCRASTSPRTTPPTSCSAAIRSRC